MRTWSSDVEPIAIPVPIESPMNEKAAAAVIDRRIGISSNPGDGKPNAFRKSHALTYDPLPSDTRLSQMPT